MSTTNKELLQSQTSTENQDSTNQTSSILIVRDKITNTPFYVNGNQEVGYFLTIGNYRLTDNKPTIEQAIDSLEQDRWNIILTLITIVNIIDEKLKQQEIPNPIPQMTTEY